MKKLPVYFIPHGGGPWHVIDDAFGNPVGYGGLRTYLTELGQKYRPKIRAIPVEHIVPLFAIPGAAEKDKGSHNFSGKLMGVNISGYKL